MWKELKSGGAWYNPYSNANAIKDIFSTESGKFELRLKSDFISDVVNSRINLIYLNAKNKGIFLTRDIQKVESSFFDRDRIAQVIDNLLTNAIKFSESGTTVLVSVKSDGEYIELVNKNI